LNVENEGRNLSALEPTKSPPDNRSQSRTNPRANQRNRVFNGSDLLPTADARSVWARLMKESYRGLIVHCGGDDTISETERMSARRSAMLEAELVFLEDKFATLRAANGEPTPADLDLYGRLADRQRRINETLGWQRTPRSVGPSLGELLAADAREQQQANAAHREQQREEFEQRQRARETQLASIHDCTPRGEG
jgi:hypothetical protein